MIRVLICDDDAPLAEDLRVKAEACFLSRDVDARIQICDSGAALCSALSQEPPDLIFLDLSLKDADGYRLAGEIRARYLKPEIVFVTSHPDRMADAFPYRPIGFIAKPASAKEIDDVINRFLLFYWIADAIYCIRSRDSSQQIPLRDILYFESSGHKVFLHLESQTEPLAQTRRLDEIDQELKDRPFIRIHKSFLVRVDAISSFDRSKLRVILKNGVNLPVSRRYSTQALEKFIHYQLR